MGFEFLFCVVSICSISSFFLTRFCQLILFQCHLFVYWLEALFQSVRSVHRARTLHPPPMPSLPPLPFPPPKVSLSNFALFIMRRGNSCAEFRGERKHRRRHAAHIPPPPRSPSVLEGDALTVQGREEAPPPTCSTHSTTTTITICIRGRCSHCSGERGSTAADMQHTLHHHHDHHLY